MYYLYLIKEMFSLAVLAGWTRGKCGLFTANLTPAKNSPVSVSKLNLTQCEHDAFIQDCVIYSNQLKRARTHVAVVFALS